MSKKNDLLCQNNEEISQNSDFVSQNIDLVPLNNEKSHYVVIFRKYLIILR